MEMSPGFLLLLIGTLSVIHTVQAQSTSQEGFISLDCGLPEDELSPYTEEKTGLQFSSDATFIQSGEIGKVEAKLESRYMKPYLTLRYFPEGTHNCYNMPVEEGRNHLIRVWFVYGNYDGLDVNPKFDLYLGSNLWATIDLERRANGTTEEIIHIPKSNSLLICLVKTGTTTPLISALEIRPMGNKLYLTKSGSLSLKYRIYLSDTVKYMRYPHDIYDRIWYPYFEKGNWTEISTTSIVSNSNNYEPPKLTLATAAIPSNDNEPLKIEWSNPDNPDEQYYLYRHFAEIQDLEANDIREFNMVWNGEVLASDPVIPKKLEVSTLLSVSPLTCDNGECILQLVRTSRSTLPPLLNAMEIYSVIQFSQSETNETDGMFSPPGSPTKPHGNKTRLSPPDAPIKSDGNNLPAIIAVLVGSAAILFLVLVL